MLWLLPPSTNLDVTVVFFGWDQYLFHYLGFVPF